MRITHNDLISCARLPLLTQMQRFSTNSQKTRNDGGPIAMVTGFVQLSIVLGAVAVVIGEGLELAH